ncbi:hypothetical protein V6N13_128024 [Hibiscus sabdariffa]
MQEVENQKVSTDHQPEPRDTYRVAYIIHFLLGAGNLLPWNAFITAVDYFGYLYPAKQVEKVFSVGYMSSSVLVLVVMMSSGCCSTKLTHRFRLNMGFSLFLLSLMVAPTIDWVSHGSWSEEQRNAAYFVTVAAVVICGLADGLITGCLIGSAGKLPKQYMQAIFAGTASSVMQQHYRILGDDPFCLRPQFWTVARKIWWPALGILMIYIVTLSIFPGFITEDLESKLLRDWYPVLLITVYNVADFMGKSLTAVNVLQRIEKATWGCKARLLFYPLFTACLHGPKWLKGETPNTSGGAYVCPRTDKWILNKRVDDPSPQDRTSVGSRIICNRVGHVPGNRFGQWLGSRLVLGHLIRSSAPPPPLSPTSQFSLE